MTSLPAAEPTPARRPQGEVLLARFLRAEGDDPARLAERLAQERAARVAAEADRDRIAAEFAAALAARDDFLAAASHDLRSPLSALLLQIQGLLRHPERAEPERLRARLRSMDRQARHMALLLDRLLDVSRLPGGGLDLHPEEMDLAELARDVAQRFEPDLEWARCSLTLRADAPVRGVWDRLRLDQVISNLLANAIKYGAGAPIEVEVRATEGGARLTVRDHGIGIAPDDHARVFERFERAAPGRHFSGLGLGLWIVRAIVEASGGSIEVDSRLGEGATFAVELPHRPSAS